VTDAARQPSHSDQSLRRVRVRLTAWYAGTFTVILVVLGAGMFATITGRYDRELDESLRDNARELVRVIHLQPDAASVAHVLDSSRFRVPERLLYVTDQDGARIAGPEMPAWLVELAKEAARTGPATGAHDIESHDGKPSRLLRAYAEPVRLATGRSLVAVSAADEVEIEDRYAALIAIFAIAALAALVMVAVGGWILARQSTAPIERSIRHMRRFMADAAHELRTPLTILRSRAEVTLQRPRQADDYVSALQAVERESARMGGIVEDLLLLARADAGERPIDRKRLFLDEVVFDAAETARVMADRSAVRLEFGELPEIAVEGDGALLVQLVIILLDNAIKYTPAGGAVRVSLAADASTAALTVADTGVGIAAEHLPHVFDRFYRADAARVRDDASVVSTSEGVGLGLAIARWIAEQHGARLSLVSTPDRGTTATAVFPLVVVAA
jgi:signal transduction histidine kinase